MASGKLEVEVIARVEKLESGLFQAQASVEQASQRFDLFSQTAQKLEDNLNRLGTTASQAAAEFSPLFEKAGADGKQLLMTFKQLDQEFEDFIVQLQNMPEIDFSTATNEAIFGLRQSMPKEGENIGSMFGKQMLAGITRGFGIAALAAFTIRTIDDAMGQALDHIQGKQKDKPYGVGISIAESVAEGIASVPILGKIFELGGELGNAFHEDAGGGGLTREREQEASRDVAREGSARRARQARKQQRAEEAMQERQRREEEARSALELAELRTRLDIAGVSAGRAMDPASGEPGGLSKSEREKRIIDEAKLRKEFMREQLEFEIQQRLQSIPEAFEEERRLVEERMREEATMRFVLLEEELADRLTAVDKEYEAREKREKELAELKAEEARKIAEEEYRQAEEIAQRSFQVQEELAAAKANAQAKVAGATATFTTAGGAFTTGVNAQLNEAKLANKISKRSQDYLREMVNLMGRGIALA